MYRRPPVTPLRPDQLSAAEAATNPVIILGGAGTGKKHTIAARIAMEFLKGKDPASFAILTHTLGGAAYYMDQVAEFLGPGHACLGYFVGTPQGLALELVRSQGMDLPGMTESFTVWTQANVRGLIAETLVELGSPPMSADDEAARILQRRNLTLAGFPDGPDETFRPRWADVMQHAANEMVRQNAMDHALLVPLVNQMLEQDTQLRDQLASLLCQNLLADGWQDFSPAERRMVGLLAGRNGSLVVAANPNERVTAGAGTCLDIVEMCRSEHCREGGAERTWDLKLNLRTTEAIGEALNRLTSDPDMTGLEEENHRYLRDNYAMGDELVPMHPPELLEFEGHPPEMYEYIFDRVEGFARLGYPLDDMACIFHDDKILEQLKLRAASLGLPFTVLRAGSRDRDRHASVLVGLLRSVLNPRDLNAFRAAASFSLDPNVRLLDRTISSRVQRMADDRRISLARAASVILANPLIDQDTRRGLQFFADACQHLDRVLAAQDTYVDDVCFLAVARLEEALGPAYPLRRKPSVCRLLELAGIHSLRGAPRLTEHDPRLELQDFLDSINLDVEGDPLSPDNHDPRSLNRGITFSSVTGCRGLEWGMVWAVGVSDDILPGPVALGNRSVIEQAQRLFHLLSSRARDRLFYCYCVQGGSTRNLRPSRFLEPIGDLLQRTVVPPSNSRPLC